MLYLCVLQQKDYLKQLKLRLMKDMECRALIPLLVDTSAITVTLIRVYNGVIAVLNIVGNAILIWGLYKTRQTNTISYQYIIFMSISDLMCGVGGLVLLTLVPWNYYVMECLLHLSTQFFLSSCNLFSCLMVVLVALDRYLHMRYLERYSIVFTKKRGYFLSLASFFFAIFINVILLLPVPSDAYYIIRLICSFASLPFIFATLCLYYCAMRELKRKVNQISRSIITQSRILSRAAKRITICIIVLTVPLAIITIFGELDINHKFKDRSVIYTFRWFAYVTYLINPFCSSYIFLSQNRPIWHLVRRAVIDYRHRMRSAVGAQQPNE